MITHPYIFLLSCGARVDLGFYKGGLFTFPRVSEVYQIYRGICIYIFLISSYIFNLLEIPSFARVKRYCISIHNLYPKPAAVGYFQISI